MRRVPHGSAWDAFIEHQSSEQIVTQLDQKAEYGLEVIGSMAGGAFAEQMRAVAESDGFGADLARMALNYAFADAWGRQGLDRKSKSIAIISALIAMRQNKELKNHVRIGLANGLDIHEFESLLVQLTPYVGLPATASATTEIVEALREANRDPAVKTAEERGLL